MPDADVVVVGGGLAGCTAALAASRADPAATVRLVTAGESSLRKASGLIDVLGYGPAGDGPVVDPFKLIPDLPDDHPYRRVGLEAVREGLALFDDVTGDRYAGGHTDRNALVPTFGGRVKPTARYPASVAPGLASDPAETLFVGYDSLSDYDARLLSKRLGNAGVPFEFDAIDLPFPRSIDDQPPQLAMARALDANESRDGKALRTAVGESGDQYSFTEDRVGFPAVLGLDDPAGVRNDVGAELDGSIFEVPMGPPSVLGYRLEATLHEALEDAEIAIDAAHPIVEADTGSGTVERVRTAEGTAYEASGFILATGGLVGGGIRGRRDGVGEPVFDCPVTAPPDRGDWAQPGPLGEHPFARFGVDIDETARPMEAGTPCYDNLYAAGSVVGGHDLAAELSGSGVSLATGYRAGVGAVEY